MLGAALAALRRGRRYRRLSSTPGPWSWSRVSSQQSARWATVVVDGRSGVAFSAEVDLDGEPLAVPFTAVLSPSPPSAGQAKAPTTALVDDLRARVQTMALDVTLTPDRVDVLLPLDGPPIDWRILGAFVVALDGLGRPGRLAWLGPTEPTALRSCPTCQVPMRTRTGAHLEDECPTCRGSFFEGGVAATVLQERFGLSPGEVIAAADATGVGGACPACARPLRPVLLDDVIGDVCAGCGGVWLDAGERETLLR